MLSHLWRTARWKTALPHVQALSRCCNHPRNLRSVFLSTTTHGGDGDSGAVPVRRERQRRQDNQNRKEKSPSSGHGWNCQCALCQEQVDGIRAIYVPCDSGNKTPMFTGIVQVNEQTYIKLDDVQKEDISNPIGHVMDEVELVAEWSLYDKEIKFPADDVYDITRNLQDFARHPHRSVQETFTLSDGSYVDDKVDYNVMFPFPNSHEYPYDHPMDPKVNKQVRALDAIMCMTHRNQLFWNTVLAVSAHGQVLAETKAAVPGLVDQYSIVKFALTNILYLQKGPHWQKKNNNNDNKTRARMRANNKKRSKHERSNRLPYD